MTRKISVSVCLALVIFMLLSTFAFGLTKGSITSITLDKTSLTMEVGSTFTQYVTLTPATALKNQIRWSTSDKNIARVNYEGTITALKIGKATIYATSPDNRVSAKCTVTVIGKEEPVEIKIPVFERGRQGQQPADTGYWAKWIKDKVLQDLNIKITWVPIARPNPNGTKEAFNLLIAANTAPDIVTEYDISPGYMGWLGQGVFQEIPEKLISQYAPNYLKFEGSSVVSIGNIKGKQMFLPAKRPVPLDSTYVYMIRQDWLDKVGLRNPQTVDEFYNVLKAFKTKDPGNVGTDKVIPYTLDLNGAISSVNNYVFRPGNLSDKEKFMYSDVALPALSWGPTRDWLKFFNKLYSEGLISPEFMLDTDSSKARSAFMNGYGGVWPEYLTNDADYIGTLMRNVPTAKLSTLYPYKKDANSALTCYYYTPPVGLMNGINKNCKNVPEVLKYLDWLAKPENLNVLQWGIEGKTYTVTNGKKSLVTYTGEEQLLNGNNKDYYALVVEGVDMGSDWDNMEYAACPAGEQYRYLMEDNFKYLRSPYQTATPNIFIPTVISSQTTLGPSLVTKYKEYACNLIMCKPSEFDSLYAKCKEDYLASGYQKILDEKAKTFDEWFAK